MGFEFNIIFTPGTVKYLSLFLWSLLKWSDCSFRLVSNGCLPPERRYLKKLSQHNPRLEFWAIPTKSSKPHGLALNYLHAMTHSKHFCFMDSDIFATGDFISQLARHQDRYAGIFSGAPIWLKPEEEILSKTYPHMGGMFNRSESGMCLGSTFFAIYDNNSLTELMQSTGIGFEECGWYEISPDIRERLIGLGMEKRVYDTAKVLNMLLLFQEEQLIYENSPSLCHIGGTSFHGFYTQQPQSIKAKLIEKLADSRSEVFRNLAHKYWSKITYRRFRQLMQDAEFQSLVTQRKKQRDPTRRYFFSLLEAMFENQPLPTTPEIGDVLIDQRIAKATKEIKALYREFGEAGRAANQPLERC